LDLDYQCIALSAAAAERGAADAATPGTEGVDQSDCDPGAGGTERMAQGYSPAVDVNPVVADVEHLCRPECDCGEGFVYLNEIEIFAGEAGCGQRLIERFGRAFMECGVRTGGLAVCDDLRHDGKPGGLGCSAVGDDDGGGAI